MEVFANQKIITVQSTQITKNSKYGVFEKDATYQAMCNLKKSSFYIYTYMNLNQNGYTFALSSKEVQDKTGIGHSAYNDAIKELLEKGYLQKIENNQYIFKATLAGNQMSKVAYPKNGKPLAENQISLIRKPANTLAENQLRNSTNNTEIVQNSTVAPAVQPNLIANAPSNAPTVLKSNTNNSDYSNSDYPKVDEDDVKEMNSYFAKNCKAKGFKKCIEEIAMRKSINETYASMFVDIGKVLNQGLDKSTIINNPKTPKEQKERIEKWFAAYEAQQAISKAKKVQALADRAKEEKIDWDRLRENPKLTLPTDDNKIDIAALLDEMEEMIV